MKATRGILLVKDITQDEGFSTPAQKGDLRKGEVIDVGGFLWHINHEKIYAEPKVGDKVYYVYNGNETIPGTNINAIIFDQLRAYEKSS